MTYAGHNLTRGEAAFLMIFWSFCGAVGTGALLAVLWWISEAAAL